MNKLEDVSVFKVILKIFLIHLIVILFVFFIGLVFNLHYKVVGMVTSGVVYISIVLALMNTFHKKGIIVNRIFGSVNITKNEMMKYIGIQLLFVLFSISAIITVINIINFANEDFISEFINGPDTNVVENTGLFLIIVGLIVTITLAPLAEELLFRGFLFNKWGESIGLF
ncbi:membrane protease YdiL (CAAX protease family) [Bacillus mesophilus]|uniref:CAAX prenyl protease 2/Lysostaphin resistance protein A-like domain-containing protein n=1 Tax=Bacillus mesophilus TaxID=1808955 RepID=A0A6M0QD09_9BACI|nr:CPBP family glutamic-type intramembrane protease [Bacillus mesophilus]MBM7663536.1 membrane protease YdiL (CAAX protease family) [Bacillus mesophilus]NEY74242.1 hypothetical protein [Bacillus mesophilus]